MNLAYAAGILDGEGCVQFSRCRTTMFPRVLIVNTDRALLEAFQAAFGGDIKPLALRRLGWKQGFQWRISWARAVAFLDKVNPWLRIKREQANTVFAWNAVKPGRGRDWDAETKHLLAQRMTWLNAKGPRIGIDPIAEYL